MDTTGKRVWIVLYGFIFDKHNFAEVDRCEGFVAKHNFNRDEVAHFETKQLAEQWLWSGKDHNFEAWQTAIIQVYAREVGL